MSSTNSSFSSFFSKCEIQFFETLRKILPSLQISFPILPTSLKRQKRGLAGGIPSMKPDGEELELSSVLWGQCQSAPLFPNVAAWDFKSSGWWVSVCFKSILLLSPTPPSASHLETRTEQSASKVFLKISVKERCPELLLIVFLKLKWTPALLLYFNKTRQPSTSHHFLLDSFPQLSF